MNYEKYKEEYAADIKRILEKKSFQPILFVGSGFSARYAEAPNWASLLSLLAKHCPLIQHDVAYYIQSGMSLPKIGSIYADAYKEWAWGEGRENFPQEYFSAKYSGDVFIKYAIAKYIANICSQDKLGLLPPDLLAEIELLQKINPHALISTNYDSLLEFIFPEYSPIVGQQVILQSYMSVGEVFKIHGCNSSPESLVFTAEDYEKFQQDKKYLSAKMLTFFVEHPLLFVGYSASDDNIKSILEEINNMLPEGQDLIENIYIIDYMEDLNSNSYPSKERVIDVGGGRSIRIKSIGSKSYDWIFSAFKNSGPLENVNVNLLRSISHRVFDLVRKGSIQSQGVMNFQMLNHALDNPDEFAKVYGVAALSNPALVNVLYPYLPNAAAALIDPKWKWQKMNYLMDDLKRATQFDMRDSDNKFHVHLPPIRRYSVDAVNLLLKFKNGESLPDLSDPEITGELVKP